MTTKRIIQFSVVFIMLGMMETSMAFIQEQQPMYNTAKQKLMEGKSILVGRYTRRTRTFIVPWPMPVLTSRGLKCSTAR